MSDPFAALDTLWSHIWDRLDRGVAHSADPFRLVTLATTGPDGPQARTVGLRGADRIAHTVEVHSDLRTAKVRALERDPRAEILLWDAGAQLQLRLRVTMEVLPADEGRWARVPAVARVNYGTDPAPGTPVAAPEEVHRTADVTRFGALRGIVERMDVVSLAHYPHRRAIYKGDAGCWVAP